MTGQGKLLRGLSESSGSELFIVDNRDDEWKVVRYLHDWCQLAKGVDIASGFFEIGSLLALDGEWQKVDKIRILMGDEVSRRTRRAFEKAYEAMRCRLDDSIETEKEKNDFLIGVPAIVEALRNGKIECRIYRKEKFHAKAYITHGRLDVIGSYALVGSSNFTYPGLTENVELNVQITGTPVAVLQDWYEEHWEEAEDVTPEILRVVERHTREFLPFEVYAKSLQELFHGYEQSEIDWERTQSRIYPILARYQKEGYHAVLKRANKHGGAFLCDGVGLGKTFIGMMLIERLVIRERKRVLLLVPKAANEPVWRRELGTYLPDLLEGGFYSFQMYNHTDLSRDKMREVFERVRAQADVIIIDEAHHFRNTGTRGDEETWKGRSRYWRLCDVAEGKQVFHLTATPINNSLRDFQHMIEIFSSRKSDYFNAAPLGIHSLSGHIRKLERTLERAAKELSPDDDTSDLNLVEAEDVLATDALFRELVVQRSRKYVKRSTETAEDGEILFPLPRKPKVCDYSVKQTYGKLLQMVSVAFHKREPLFTLSIYNPYVHYTGDDPEVIPSLERGRRKQIVSLVRTGFLKRFESSAEAFRASCWNLMRKLLAWLEVHAETPPEKDLLAQWKRTHAGLVDFRPQFELWSDEDDEDDEDFVSPEMLDTIDELSRDDFDIEKIVQDTIQDLDQIAAFLMELEAFEPRHDKKLQALIRLLKTDPILKEHKVLIFTEFMTTARYLKDQLLASWINGVAEMDSDYKGDRMDMIRRFSPYYNGSSSAELSHNDREEIRVLISTDVLSEGLNLQDATRLINYELHWNPVRLMQRIGRVDRRMNPDVEQRIIDAHPERATLRGTVEYWNFLPPGELDELLRLYQRVAHKTLRISKTLGIEGKKLLKEDDDYEDLRNFTERYEGRLTSIEEMHLEYQQLVREQPDLEEQLNQFPKKVFSGKENLDPGTQAVFFCIARPAHDPERSKETGEDEWTAEAGDVKWYLYDLESGGILEDPAKIIAHIRSKPDTPRTTVIEKTTLRDIRARVVKHINNSYLKKVQAPVGVKPIVRAWMELN